MERLRDAKFMRWDDVEVHECQVRGCREELRLRVLRGGSMEK